MNIIAPVVVLSLALVAGTVSTARAACPADAAERAAELRDRLDRERGRASRWRWGWAAGFGAASVVQGTLWATETNPLGDFDDGFEGSIMVGTIKSTIGMTARIVAPIKVPRPTVTGDACADLAAAEAAFARAAKSEKQGFWLNHVGGLALQVAGTMYIGMSADDAWDDAMMSFGLGYTIGLISTYTQPRGIWKHQRSRERSPDGGLVWQMTPMVTPRAQGLVLSGSF